MNVVLIGFMGSGKTTIGRRLARRLGYRFLDTDQFIEQEIGRTIAEIFASEGESYFRELETRVARRLPQLENTVIATGGGMPMTPGNLDLLKRAGPVVFLKADPEDIIQRLERDTRRPIMQQGNVRDTVTNLLGRRLPVYSQADLVVETGGKGMQRVAGDIIRFMGTFSRSAPQETAPADSSAPSRE